MKNYIFKFINFLRFIFELIKYFFIKVKKIKPNHYLDKKITVSLSAKRNRFLTLHFVLKSIFNQSFHPDEIILWIEKKDQKHIPKRILKFKKIGLKIFFCNNLKSYNKIIHTLRIRKKNYIITFDDDIIYNKDSIKSLLSKAKKFKGKIIANRVHRIKLKNNDPIKYKDWIWNSQNKAVHRLNFQTGVYGVLYPPNSFHKDVCKNKIFQTLSPTADDLWLYWMVRLNKKFIVWSELKERNIEVINFDQNNLRTINIFNKNNDNQIKNLIKYYGFPK
jgi:protein O-GlcNAc transferase